MATALLAEPRTRNGLTYPFGPIPFAEPVDVAPGVTLFRLPIPGPLRHVNCLLLADGDENGGVWRWSTPG